MYIAAGKASFVLLCALSVGGSGCKPDFASKGTISVDGKPFVPASCSVLSACTGIALTSADGARLQLKLPPMRLEAWEDVSGTPSLAYTPGGGGAAMEVEACGSLTMTGEGYHGQGKRAASGHASLSCDEKVRVRGELSFEGCF